MKGNHAVFKSNVTQGGLQNTYNKTYRCIHENNPNRKFTANQKKMVRNIFFNNFNGKSGCLRDTYTSNSREKSKDFSFKKTKT